jgi:mannose-6-phosphate isomerase-like protein (cupin superfamily)
LTNSRWEVDDEIVNQIDDLTRRMSMPVLSAPDRPTHSLPGTTFTSLATPSRGSSDLSLWVVAISPGTPATPHSLTREEVFVVLAGTASVDIGGVAAIARTGDAIVVPAGVVFVLANGGSEELRLVCCMRAGGQAQLADGTLFTPPWSL